MKKLLAKALTDYINQKKNQDECVGFSDGFKAAFDLLGSELDKERPNGYICIAIVGHGYQIDILDPKKYMEGTLSILASECRDWGLDLDPEEFEKEIVTMIRNGKDNE